MSRFFAYIDRMRFINRWGLMRNTVHENDMEHSMQTAFIAHGLAVMAKERYGRDIDPLHVAVLAMYHDTSEVLTGDLPTPIKNMNPAIRKAYCGIEQTAREQLLNMLPKDMQASMSPYIKPEEGTIEQKLVKAADRISAYLKCVAEETMGNTDFKQAKQTITESLESSDLPEIGDFMREFVPSFSLSADDLSLG